MKESKGFSDAYSFVRGNVGVLMLCRTIWSLSRLGVDSFFPLYILALGGTVATVGLVSMIGSIAQFIISPIGGYLAYAIDRRKVMGVGTIMLALSYLTYVFAQDATALLIGTFIINLCFLQSPSMQSLIADSLSSEQMAVGYSLQMAIQRVTPLVLTFFGGIFIERLGLTFGVRLSYTCCMLIGLLVAYIRYRFTRETRDSSTMRIKSFSLSEIPSIIVNAYKEMFLMLRNLSKHLKIIALIAIIGSVVALITGPFWPVYAIEIINLTPSQWGFIIMFTGMLSMGVSVISGHLVNRFGRKRTMFATFFIMSSLTLLFVYCKTFLHVLAVWSLASVLISFLTPAFQALFMDSVPRKQRGQMIAALGLNPFTILQTRAGIMVGLGFIAYIPACVVTLTSGFIYDLNPMYPWFILSTFLVVLALLTRFFIREPKKYKIN